MFAMLKRVFLFMAVNVLVVLTISITLNLLGVKPYLSARGLDYGALMTFCLIWGMGGAFISLALSRVMAKWSMGVKLVDERHELARIVRRLAEKAGLPGMPEVGVYASPEPNAFATGPTKGRALVAVSSGLLEAMDKDELEGVLGHEVAHIANGDMVTMTLIQGVINAFVMFLARVLGYFIASQMSRGEERERSSFGMQYMITFALEIAFSVLGMVVVAWFSRRREYRADAGGAKLAGRQNMLRALQALQRTFEPLDPKPAYAALQIAGGGGGWRALISTHPPLTERISRLSTGESFV